MYVQSKESTINYTKLSGIPNANFKAQNPVKNNTYEKDTIELSNASTHASKVMGNILNTDKGTGSHTTLYVDNSTFQKIATYSTYHPDTRWSEMGVDENKRWIVVNGQRFESPKSEEEKAQLRRAQMTLLDHLQEYYDNKEDMSLKEKITLDFLDKSTDVQTTEDLKLKNLLQNEEVMDMLKNISKSSSGKISVSL